MVPRTEQTEFNALVKPFLKSLENTALRLTKDSVEAEDLLQETFYKSYKAFGSYERNTNFKAWIFRILMNTYITAYRKAVRRPQKVRYEDVEDFMPSQNPVNDSSTFDIYSPDFGIFEDELKTALEKVPYYFRLIVLLSDVEEFSYQEIAEMLNIPVGTVMSRLHRGRSLLRTKLTKYAKAKGYGHN
jgi:RNA polymerase sigma-70 factor (ECF subfamily)